MADAIELDRRCGHVAVERVVQVLVERHANEEAFGDRITRDRSGVAVSDARGQLLERDVDQRVEWSVDAPGIVAAPDVLHALALERDGIDRARGDQIVADGDRVAGLLGGPAPRPFTPGALATEHVPQCEVVVGEVVLRQQVQLERRAGGGIEPRVGLAPRMLGEAASLLPGHVLVGKPLPGGVEMTIEQPGDDGLEGVQGAAGRHRHGDHADLLAARSRECCILTIT